MPKPDVSLRSSKKQGDDQLRMAALTRDDVAKRLGVRFGGSGMNLETRFW